MSQPGTPRVHDQVCPTKLGRALLERLQLPKSIVVRNLQLSIDGSDTYIQLTVNVTAHVAEAVAAALEDAAVATKTRSRRA